MVLLNIGLMTTKSNMTIATADPKENYRTSVVRTESPQSLGGMSENNSPFVLLYVPCNTICGPYIYEEVSYKTP